MKRVIKCYNIVVFIENREDMLNPANNKLIDVLEEANRLFASGNICTPASINLELLNCICDGFMCIS